MINYDRNYPTYAPDDVENPSPVWIRLTLKRAAFGGNVENFKGKAGVRKKRDPSCNRFGVELTDGTRVIGKTILELSEKLKANYESIRSAYSHKLTKYKGMPLFKYVAKEDEA